MKRKKYFTLLELLVVLALIGILLSLLLPSLNRARYKAKLAVCLSTLRQNSIVMHQYANSCNNDYPKLEGRAQRWNIVHKFLGDDRREFLENVFGSIDEPFNCALADFGVPRSTSNAGQVYINYEFYAGTKLVKNNNKSAMFNRMQETEHKGEAFTVMMGDQLRSQNDGTLISSHPAENLEHGIKNSSDFFVTRYRGSHYFKKMDRNFVYRDGHAKTIRNMSTANGTNLTDSRFIKIDSFTKISNEYKAWVPFDEN